MGHLRVDEAMVDVVGRQHAKAAVVVFAAPDALMRMMVGAARTI